LAYIFVMFIRGIGNKLNANKDINFNYFKFTIYIYIIIILAILLFMNNYSFSRAEGCVKTALMNVINIVKYASSTISLIVGGKGAFGNSSIVIGFIIFIMQIIMIIFISFKLYFKANKNNFIILMLLLTSVSFVLNAGAGRHCLGIESAYASRYYLLIVPGVIGLLIAFDLLFKNKSSFFVTLFSLFIISSQVYFIPSQSEVLGQAYFNHKNNFLLCLDKEGASVSECNSKFSIYPPDSIRLETFLKRMASAKGV